MKKTAIYLASCRELRRGKFNKPTRTSKRAIHLNDWQGDCWDGFDMIADHLR